MSLNSVLNKSFRGAYQIYNPNSESLGQDIDSHLRSFQPRINVFLAPIISFQVFSGLAPKTCCRLSVTT
ncbi:hypothetical protein YC2023_017393 [Brassica napus]